MRFNYRSLSQADLQHGIKQAKQKIRLYEIELRRRRNWHATRCTYCGKRAIFRSYSFLRHDYGTYGITTSLCEEDHTLSDVDFKNGDIIERLPENSYRIVPHDELDEFSRKLYGTKGGIER